MPSIHTTVSSDTKRKLLEYGKGSLKDGIENLVIIADSNRISVTIVTDVEV